MQTGSSARTASWPCVAGARRALRARRGPRSCGRGRGVRARPGPWPRARSSGRRARSPRSARTRCSPRHPASVAAQANRSGSTASAPVTRHRSRSRAPPGGRWPPDCAQQAQRGGREQARPRRRSQPSVDVRGASKSGLAVCDDRDPVGERDEQPEEQAAGPRPVDGAVGRRRPAGRGPRRGRRRGARAAPGARAARPWTCRSCRRCRAAVAGVSGVVAAVSGPPSGRHLGDPAAGAAPAVNTRVAPASATRLASSSLRTATTITGRAVAEPVAHGLHAEDVRDRYGHARPPQDRQDRDRHLDALRELHRDTVTGPHARARRGRRAASGQRGRPARRR